MKYTRLYAKPDGTSHFEDIEIEFVETDYLASAPPLSLSVFSAAKEFGFMQAPAGWQSDWHPSAARNLFVVTSGEWEITAGDGETRRFGPASVLLVEDTKGKGHKSRVVSEVHSVAVMLQL